MLFFKAGKELRCRVDIGGDGGEARRRGAI
jgi:hypothetical protein